MNKQDFNEGLLGFLDASPTPFHATLNMSMMLSNAGFIKLSEIDKWELVQGKSIMLHVMILLSLHLPTHKQKIILWLGHILTRQI